MQINCNINDEIAALSVLLEACRSSIADPMFPSPQKRSEMVRILHDRGKCFARIQNYTDAFIDISLVINLQPDTAFFCERAQILAFLGKHPLALEDLATAIKINPTNHEIYDQRAKMHLNWQDYETAMKDFSLALDAVKRKRQGFELEAKYNCLIGQCLYHLGRYSESLSVAMKLLGLQPNNTGSQRIVYSESEEERRKGYTKLMNDSISCMNDIERERNGGERKSYFVVINGLLQHIHI